MTHCSADSPNEEPTSKLDPMPVLLDVNTVAALFDCSPRHIYRLADSGRMPRPIRLGSLVRWSRTEIETWICKGCPHDQGKAIKR